MGKLLNEKLAKQGYKPKNLTTFYKAYHQKVGVSPKFSKEMETITGIPYDHFLFPDSAPENPWVRVFKYLTPEL